MGFNFKKFIPLCVASDIILFCLMTSCITTIHADKTSLRRLRKNVTQIANVGSNSVVFNHVYSINVPSETLSCDCPITSEQNVNPQNPESSKKSRFKFDSLTSEYNGNENSVHPVKELHGKGGGYVTPSEDDVDEFGRPYADRFHFNHKITIPEQKCPCTSNDLRKVKQQNKSLRSIISALEAKLNERINKLQKRIEGQDKEVSSCSSRCNNKAPLVDVIGDSNSEEQALTSPFIEAKCPWNCSGNGKCIDGLCHCKKGYRGDSCRESKCLNGCSGHGACNKHGKCNCWGQWKGKDCSERGCIDDCSGNGYCQGGSCACFQGYSGETCSNRDCPSDCMDHGKCDVITGICSCHGNWEGVDCSTRKCPRDCSGHGTCVGGQCQCNEPWIGKACRNQLCRNDCSLNGKCRNGTCLCGSKWSGSDCSNLRCPSDCSGLGDCHNGTCTCIKGWTGEDCTQIQCPDMCSHHGRCVGDVCSCHDGWHGINCGNVLKPDGLRVTNVQPTTIDVSWTKTSSAITGNQVNCIPMSGTANAVYQSVGSNVTKLTIRDLDSGTQYSVFVYAMVENTLSTPITASVKTAIDSPTKLGWLRIGDSFAELSWLPPKATIDRYKLVCSCKQGGPEFIVLANKTSVMINDLSPGETYTVTLYAEQGANVSSPIHINFTTSLDAPDSIEFINVTTTSASIKWSKSHAKISGYLLTISERDGRMSEPITYEVSHHDNHYSFTGLEADTSYDVELHSYRGTMQSLPLHTILLAGIETPVNFTVTNIQPNEAGFRWKSPNKKIKQFRITLSPESLYNKGVPSLVDSILPKDRHHASFTNLMPGNAYVIEVFSVDGDRESGPLTKRIITGIKSPSGLFVDVASSQSIIVRWEAMQIHVDGYTVTCTNVKSRKTHELKLSSDDLSAEFDNLKAAMWHNISVVAHLDKMTSLPSSILAATALPSPVNMFVSSPSYDDLVIVWDPVNAFHDENIMGMYHVKAEPLGSHNTSSNTEKLDFMIPPGNTALTIPGMTSGLTYDITIVAKSRNDVIPQSLTLSTTFTIPVDPPQGVTMSYVGYKNATVHWYPSSAPATGYLVEFQDIYQISDIQSMSLDSNHTFATLDDLSDDTTYFVNVSSVLHNRSSVASTAIFSTEMMIIEPPEYLHATEVTPRSITIEWMASLTDGISGYYISLAHKSMPGKSMNLTVNEDTLVALFNDLSPDTMYTINVFTIHKNRVSVPVQLFIKTDMDSPAHLMFVTVSDSSFSIHWRAPVAVTTNYIVTYYRSKARQDRQDLIIPGSETVCSIHNLDSATEYTVEIFAMNNQSQSDATIAMVTTLPGSVIQLRSPKQGINHIVLTWIAPDSGGNISGYQVEYYPNSNLQSIEIIQLDANEEVVTLRDLAPATKYTIIVYSKKFPELGEGRTITVPTLIPHVKSVVALPFDDNSVIIRWKSPLDVTIDRYIIEHRSLEVVGDFFETVLSSDATSHVIDGLVPDTEYSVRISAILDGFKSKTRQIKATTASPLESPSDIMISDVRDTSAHIAWEALSDSTITGYSLRYKPVGGFGVSEIVKAIAGRKMTSTMLMKLQPGTLYYISIATERHGRFSFPPVTQRFVTSQTLTSPTDVKVGEVTESSIHLSWATQKADSVEEYHVTYSLEHGGFGETSEIVSANNDSANINITGLHFGSSYRIDIRSFRWGVDSVNATSRTITTLHKLLPPTKVLITNTNQTGVMLAWDPQTPDADSYNITISRNGEDMRYIIVPPLPAIASIGNLQPSNRYVLKIAAKRGDQISESTFIDCKTDDLLVPPYNVTTQLIGETGARLHWMIPRQIYQKIRVKYASDGWSDYNSVDVGRDETSVELFDLTPGTLYDVQIVSINKDKTSQPLIHSLTTDYIIPPPANLHFTGINETSLKVKWEQTSPRAQYYRITYKSDDEGPRIITIPASSSKVTIEHLTSGSTYNVSVTSLGNRKESKPLIDRIATVLKSPHDMRINERTSRSVHFSWNPLSLRVDGYSIEYYNRDDDARTTSLVNMNPNNTSANITNLLPGRSYAFQLIAKKDEQQSRSNVQVVQTEIDPPRRVRTAVIARRSANLTWIPSSAPGISGYRVSLFATHVTLGKLHRIFNVSSHKSYIWLKHLLPSTKYTVCVSSIREHETSIPFTVHFKTGKVPYPQPKNCHEVLLNGEWRNGLYEVHLPSGRRMDVFCDLQSDGGGWIVVQRRSTGEIKFNKTWSQYVGGFGRQTGEFWIGLRTLHELTSIDEQQQLRIDFKHESMSAYATYEMFTISDEESGFNLNVSDYEGNAGDSLSYHVGMKFTTSDRDNDEATNRNCAEEYKGAWWYRNCHRSNLNGQYANTKHSKGINWYTWGGFTRSIEFVEMKIRPQNYQKNNATRRRHSSRRRRSDARWFHIREDIK